LSILQYSGGVMVVLAIVISIIQEHQALKKADQSATQSPTS
jgi:hypothetical protein